MGFCELDDSLLGLFPLPFAQEETADLGNIRHELLAQELDLALPILEYRVDFILIEVIRELNTKGPGIYEGRERDPDAGFL